MLDIHNRSSLRSQLFSTDTKVPHLEISARVDQSISLTLNFILNQRCLFSVVESKDSPLSIYVNQHMEICNIELIFTFAFLPILIERLSTFFPIRNYLCRTKTSIICCLFLYTLKTTSIFCQESITLNERTLDLMFRTRNCD